MYQVKPVGGQSRHIVKGDKLLGFLEEGWGRTGNGVQHCLAVRCRERFCGIGSTTKRAGCLTVFWAGVMLRRFCVEALVGGSD